MTGVAGVAGATGIAGNAGATGAKGATGVAGATGVTGVAGATGVAGIVGATGVAGATGVVGATGVAGTIGATGVSGSVGPAGASGQKCLFSQSTSKTVANTTAELSLRNSANAVGALTIPSSALFKGSAFLLRAAGVLRNAGSSTSLQLKLFSNELTVLDTGSFNMASVNSSRGWTLEVQIMYDGANLISIGNFSYVGGSNTFSGWCGQTSQSVGSNADVPLDFITKWNFASTSNTITCNTLVLFQIN